MIEVRTYQLEILEKVIQAIKKGKKRILIVSPTGSGKTNLELALIQLLHSTNPLIIVPFLSIKDQTEKELLKYKLPGIVSTYQSVILQSNIQADLLLCDESHYHLSPSWRQVSNIVKSPITIGLTATPFRTDCKPFLEEHGGLYDELIYGPSIKDLTKEHYLAKIVYYSIPLHKTESYEPIVVLNNIIGYLTKVKFTPNSNIDLISYYTEHFNNLQTIIFCDNIYNANILSDKFNANGIMTKSINCHQSKAYRKDIISQYKDNKVKVLTTCNSLSTGFDAPNTEVVFLNKNIHNSLVSFIQMIGRGIRPYKDKITKIVDMYGNIYRFGLLENAVKRKVV